MFLIFQIDIYFNKEHARSKPQACCCAPIAFFVVTGDRVQNYGMRPMLPFLRYCMNKHTNTHPDKCYFIYHWYISPLLFRYIFSFIDISINTKKVKNQFKINKWWFKIENIVRSQHSKTFQEKFKLKNLCVPCTVNTNMVMIDHKFFLRWVFVVSYS